VTCSLPADRLEGNQVGCIDHAATGGGTRSSGISSVGCAQAQKTPGRQPAQGRAISAERVGWDLVSAWRSASYGAALVLA